MLNQLSHNTQYDWIGGKPVQTDNTNFDWSGGQPYIIYEHSPADLENKSANMAAKMIAGKLI